jgi:thioredoxin-like negative regulator of GroEL
MRSFLTLLVLAAIGYCGFLGYQKWQESRDPADVGKSAMESKDFASAIPYLEKARRLRPADQTIVLQLAECYFRTGDKARSISYYSTVENLINDPNQAVAMRKHRERVSTLRAAGF